MGNSAMTYKTGVWRSILPSIRTTLKMLLVLVVLVLPSLICDAARLCPSGQYRRENNCSKCANCASTLFRETIYQCMAYTNAVCGKCLPGNVDMFQDQNMPCTPCYMQPNHAECIKTPVTTPVTTTVTTPVTTTVTTTAPEDTAKIAWWIVLIVVIAAVAAVVFGIWAVYYCLTKKKCCRTNGSVVSGSTDSLKEEKENKKDNEETSALILRENGTVPGKKPNPDGNLPAGSCPSEEETRDNGETRQSEPLQTQVAKQTRQEESLQSAEPIPADESSVSTEPPDVTSNDVSRPPLHRREQTPTTTPPNNAQSTPSSHENTTHDGGHSDVGMALTINGAHNGNVYFINGRDCTINNGDKTATSVNCNVEQESGNKTGVQEEGQLGVAETSKW